MFIELMMRTLWERSDGNNLLQSLFHLMVSYDTLCFDHPPKTCFSKLSAAEAENLDSSFSHTSHLICQQILSVQPFQCIQHLAPSNHY